MEKLLIGKILKPRGLRGELKVQVLTNKPEIFLSIKEIFIKDKSYMVMKSSVQNGFGYVSLDGVKNVEIADEMRGLELRIDKKDFKLDHDEIFEIDLIGFDIITESGQVLGKLECFENFGGGEVIVVGEYSIPYEDEFIVETNMKEKKIIVKDDVLTVEEIR